MPDHTVRLDSINDAPPKESFDAIAARASAQRWKYLALILMVLSLGLIIGLIVVGADDDDDDNGSSSSSSSSPTGEFITVSSTNGPLKGAALENNIAYFKSIRYAQPPIGDLRLADPQPLTETWTEAKDTFFDAPGCMQDSGILLTTTVSEDCLYLSIAHGQSSTDPNELLPVMVYIANGGNNECAINQGVPLLYNPITLLNTWPEAVIVIVQIRLGPLGFMSTRTMMEEEQNNNAGNYGYKDALMALQYIQDNIVHFNGDKNRVMVVGESAGSNLASWLVVNSNAAGLVQRAVIESTTFTLGGSVQTLESGYQSAARMANSLGCLSNDTACLRGVDAGAWLTRPNTTVFNELLPTTLMPRTDWLELQAPAEIENHVPTIIGSNSAELFNACNVAPTAGPSVYAGYISQQIHLTYDILFGEAGAEAIANQLLTAYPANCTAGGINPCCALATKVLNSLILHCSGIRFARALESIGQTVHMYWFDQPITCPLGQPAEGSSHTTELQYVWGAHEAFYLETTKEQQQCTWSASDYALSDAMIQYWQQFAKAGDPNMADSTLANWEPWTSSNQKCMHFRAHGDTPVPVIIDCPVSNEFCEAIDAINTDLQAMVFNVTTNPPTPDSVWRTK